MMDRIRITATGAGLSYYPEFVARELGYFEDEDLLVETQAPGHGPWVTRALRDGSADIALGGIWRPLMYRGRLEKLCPFAQLCVRCPSLVVGRAPIEGARWSDLVRRKVVVPDGSPTPLMALLGILRRHRVDPWQVKWISDFHHEEAWSLFRGGLGDFYVASPPASDVLGDDGTGHVVLDLAEGGGRIPYSFYYSHPEFLERPENLAGRFARAIQRALTWTHAHEPEEAPGVIETHFPALRPELVADSIRATRARGVYPESIRVDEADLDHWQEMIIENHLIDAKIPYSEIFESRFADWVRDHPEP